MQERSITLDIKEGPISKDLPVFYNPIMQCNRDTSILLLRALDRKGMQLVDPLAGSGIRTLRFLKELPSDMIKLIYVNDYRENFEEQLKEGLKKNGLSDGKLEIGNKEASDFIWHLKGYDYCDIDPYGSPNSFLDSAMKRLSRDAILAMTTTDTAALCGTYKGVCRRKYWAEPLHNYLMHETGLRILIRKVQLIGAQYEKALIPVFSYSKDHYMRIMFRCKKSKEACDKVLAQHGLFEGKGPMWLGSLGDVEIVGKMIEAMDWEDNELLKFLTTIKGELEVGGVGFYDVHELSKELGLAKIKRSEMIIKELREAGYEVSLTHFRPTGIRTNAEKKTIEKIVKI